MIGHADANRDGRPAAAAEAAGAPAGLRYAAAPLPTHARDDSAACASDDGVIAGWYGKLPTLGDFASRRLPAAFVSVWDDWLCARLAHSRAALGEDWLDLYLTCPVWRFFAMPGALGADLDGCWSGVLMPSVDRVGRHFPLTIAAPLDDAPLRCAAIDALWAWLQAVERIALTTLASDRSSDELDARLASERLPGWLAGSRAAASVASGASGAWGTWSGSAASGCAAQLPALLRVPPGATLGDALADGFAPLWRALAHGVSLWSCVPLAAGTNDGTDATDAREATDATDARDGTDATDATRAASANRAASAASTSAAAQSARRCSRPFAVLCTRGLPDDRMFVSMLTGAEP